MPPVLCSSGTLGLDTLSLLGVPMDRAEPYPPTEGHAPIRLMAEVTLDLGVTLD